MAAAPAWRERLPGGLVRSGRLSSWAARRGRGEGSHVSAWGGPQRWIDAVLRRVAGELRGSTSPLHKEKNGEALRVSEDSRNKMEGSIWRNDVGGDRNVQKTAAD